MTLAQRLPARGEVDLAALLAEFGAPGRRPPAPFAPESLRFCAALSAALFAEPRARRLPEVQALAFWLRPGELRRLAARFESLGGGDELLVPRGLVFHVPPGNVGTMFAYSWIFALLTGNASVLRLPSRPSPAAQAVLDVLDALLARAEHAGVARSVWMLSYGHEEEISAALSLAADMRVIWGGDETVRRLRALPSPPLSKDLAFPDRWSLCALQADALLALDAQRRQALAERFYNDTYWFEQQACSSPRLVLWCGTAEAAARAGEAFFSELDAVLRRKEEALSVSSVLKKLSFSFAAILDEPVTAYRAYAPGLTVMPLAGLERLNRRHCGAGLFYEAVLPRLEDLAAHVRREDQTLTHFGFARAELMAFARALGGRGLNRLVPIGEALNFGRYWDGYDLLREMTQSVHVAA